MALAAEAASVGSAQILALYLIDGKQPVPDAQPLTAQEAAYLLYGQNRRYCYVLLQND